MANRTGTYFAFDGLGQTDPTKSDFRFYSQAQAWTRNNEIEFKFVNSHDKTSAVRDSSLRVTLEARIRERLAASKNVVVIISEQTRATGSMLSYEIEKAVDRYDLPLIVAYTKYNSILHPSSHREKWPNVLADRIDDMTAKAIHIPFRQKALLAAIGAYGVNGKIPSGSLVHYTRETQIGWGYISQA